MAGGLTIAPESRDGLERIAVRLLAIAGRCGDAPEMQHALMQLGDELANIIDEISVGGTACGGTPIPENNFAPWKMT
jgi:hypothetical protein